jgi:hypothetical protein
MRHAKERGWWMIVLVLAGCQNTPETRFLSWFPRPAAQERRSYDLHDPFPDEQLGPNTFTRPRGFVQPRTEQRKTNDLQFLQAAREFAPRTQAFWDPVSPSGTVAAPVQPIWRHNAGASPIAITPRMWDGSNSRYSVVPY